MKSQRIAQLELKETRSLRLPIISLNSEYLYNKTTNEVGFLLSNKVNGFNYGATATIPLFRGFNINRQIKNSKLDLLNADIALQSTELKVKAELFDSWREFENNKRILNLEEQNIIYAREVLSIGQQRYKIGVANNVEMLDAQQTFEDAIKRLAAARYDTKISETALRRLNGELVK
jgi:outer membrane protein TolC